jgi:hypothetical protein
LHRLLVATSGEKGLFGKPLSLDYWIDQLGIASRQFKTIDVKIPFLNYTNFAAMLSNKWRGIDWIATYEGWLDQFILTKVFKEFLRPVFQ